MVLQACPRYAAAGRPCGCGTIVYLGYNYVDVDIPSPVLKWDQLLRASVTLVDGKPTLK